MAYKDLSETEKKISEIEHLDTLDANTDEVEGLLEDILSEISNRLGVIAGKLDSIESELISINGTCSGTTREVTTQGQAIVHAIEGQ